MTTSVTAAQIATLRRMVAEPLTTIYSDALLTTFIESYPLVDELGTDPYTWSQATSPATKVVSPGWIPTYDLNAAAGDIWAEKAAALAHEHSFAADGGNYQVSDKHAHYMKQASFYRSRRSAKSVPIMGS
jgi:hypothetical protein